MCMNNASKSPWNFHQVFLLRQIVNILRNLSRCEFRDCLSATRSILIVFPDFFVNHSSPRSAFLSFIGLVDARKIVQ